MRFSPLPVKISFSFNIVNTFPTAEAKDWVFFHHPSPYHSICPKSSRPIIIIWLFLNFIIKSHLEMGSCHYMDMINSFYKSLCVTVL